MRLAHVAVAVAAATLLPLAPPAAAKPADTPSSITVDGGPVVYGDTITFTTTVGVKPSRSLFVYIGVTCFQGEAQVFGTLGNLGDGFTLTDIPELAWDGGAATCTGHLIARTASSNRVTYDTLATTLFEVAPVIG